MIDKNDVKMPEQKGNTDKYGDPEFVKKIEDLLDAVNSTENNQELRLKNDYYKRFDWFGNSRAEHSYYSYQEEAVYDFIFNLNKSGILSDQVGMGKTIEAGMIVSELASRNELRSLLIIVPNEIMAQKWEDELQNKFGIRMNPEVKSLKNVDEFYKSIFSCIRAERFPTFNQYEFKHEMRPEYKEKSAEKLFYEFIHEDIHKAVDIINGDLKRQEYDDNPVVSFDGKKFTLNVVGSNEYEYDKNGNIGKYAKNLIGKVTDYISSTRFINRYRTLLIEELGGLFSLIAQYICRFPDEITNIAVNMTNINAYPILVIPATYSVYYGDKVKVVDFLNKPLLEKMDNYKHQYFALEKEEDGYGVKAIYEDYRIIDFFIDAGYQTLIVDEVHDYIEVSDKVSKKNFHDKVGDENGQNVFEKFQAENYNRYDLFDDYYFIKKSSMYKKLKTLSDKANRKIYLTATPIKSDMIDFYLLTLIASNKDSDAYKHVSFELENAFPDAKEQKNTLERLYNAFQLCIKETSAEFFSKHKMDFFRMENKEDENSGVIKSSRCRYPYFNNNFLRTNSNDVKLIAEYLISQLSYMTMEEMVVELILAYNAENPKLSERDNGIRKTIDNIEALLAMSEENNDRYEDLSFQTRVVFRSLLNNTIRIRFEEDFTKEDGTPIKQIRELLSMSDGPRRWHKTYKKYGIRHTRHQTYNLDGCDYIGELSESRQARYLNLPVWPKRNGKVIFLLRDDVFFDCLINVERELKASSEYEIKQDDLPNFDTIKASREEKAKRFECAVNIFNYINDSMSGGDSQTHKPQNSKFESIDLDDKAMVDYKLALVNRLMVSQDQSLGSISRKVLLFAEKDRDAILEWFKYQQCAPLFSPETKLDPEKLRSYEKKWQSYGVPSRCDGWKVTTEADKLSLEGNMLIIIDPKRYEKGVDLQKADTIINFDINYSPLKMEQRIGRIDRIRPNGQNQEINIISFVPLNNMSGFIINFFANEMKMFTQWMGETTGIVSVSNEDESENGSSVIKGKGVSFESRVYELEDYYQFIYRLCKEDVPVSEIEKQHSRFYTRFGGEQKFKTKEELYSDFTFINKTRPYFDKAFRNSLSPQRAGDTVRNSDKKVIRFNTTIGVLTHDQCGNEKCSDCPKYHSCNDRSKSKNNIYTEFVAGVNAFLKEGTIFYSREIDKREADLRSRRIGNVAATSTDDLLEYFRARKQGFETAARNVDAAIKNIEFSDVNAPFTIDVEYFDSKIFAPLKSLFWDEVVNKYISLLLKEFHDQCDTVLESAKLMEKFIKALSIADFMNNMGVVQGGNR